MLSLYRFNAPARATLVALTALVSAGSLAAQSPLPPKQEQAQHLLEGPTVWGGFGGIDVRASRLAGKTAVLTGARGAWLVNQRLSIGGSAWWNATPRINDVYTLPSGTRTGLAFGYGGLELGWTFDPSRLVHVTAGTLLGAGAAQFYDVRAKGRDFEQSSTDVFFVSEPSLGLELNVSRHVRLGVSGSYRFTAGARLESLDNNSFQGVGGGLTLKLGRF